MSHNEAKRRILVVADEPGLSRVLSLVFNGGGLTFALRQLEPLAGEAPSISVGEAYLPPAFDSRE